MKVELLYSANSNNSAVKKYMKAVKQGKKDLPKLELIQVVLKPVTKEKGFFIDDKFVQAVKRKIRSLKKKAVLDELLCAQVIAQFLAFNEEKRIKI